MSTVPVRLDPGSTVGPYVVERRLAQGGMSVLFLAHDPESGREVVLKIVPDEMATAASRARLLREARSLASLDHPGIVRIIGFGDVDGMPWIAMEYVRGIDLKRLVAERGPVAPELAMRWMVQACDALVAAHDAGVIHRDLKPSNLLLTPDDRIKIVDFGIAKRRADTAAGDVLTSQREVLGTPAYLSPEQLEHGLADERSDVWALGCVLYELVVGTPPFGRGGSATTMAAILRDDPVFPPHLTGAVVHIVNACLRKNSFARIGSPREMALLLRDAIENPMSELAAPPPERTSVRTSSRLSSAPVAMRPSDRPPRASPSTHPPPRSSANMPVARRASVPPTPAAMGRIKGTAIRAGLAWFTATFGPGAITRVYDLASPTLQSVIQLGDPACGVIASGWYDLANAGELLDIMQRVADPEDADAYLNLLTGAIAKDNVNGIYKSLFKLISSPAMLEANSQRVWSTYIDEGTFIARVPAPGTIEIDVRGWTHHQATVCRTVGYMIQNVLRAIGYTALVIERTQCVGDGDAMCAFEGMYLT